MNEYVNLSFENIDILLKYIEGCSAVLVGCGLSVCEDTEKIVNNLILNSQKPLIIDADGINILALFSGKAGSYQRAAFNSCLNNQ